jgi:sulfate adenylyltransferase subunit 1
VPGGTVQVDRAFAGQTVMIRLMVDVEVSRGDTLVLSEHAPQPVKKLEADLCWFDEEPLCTQRKYLLKQTTTTVFARRRASVTRSCHAACMFRGGITYLGTRRTAA